MTYFERAQELKEELVQWRRHIHQYPEAGMELPETCDYVFDRLADMGYQPKRLGGGITAAVTGNPEGKVFLLRADMDALPMREESGLPFASQRSCAHTCGHDMHTAMLLGAAKLLKERESELNGTVKFMFQPGEEVLQGAKAMIDAGILENPPVDAAMGAHMIPMVPVGLGGYGRDAVSASCDHILITVQGKGGHGARPQTTVDPINIGVHIHLALQELISRESDPGEMVVLTIGRFQSGEACNIIPNTAVLEGTLRTYNEELRTHLLQRIQSVCQLTAQAFQGEARVEMLLSTCALVMDNATSDAVAAGWKQEGLNILLSGEKMSGSEDFAEVAARVPSTFFVVGGGTAEECGGVANHHPRIRFNEDALPFGAAGYASGAAAWLDAQKT